MSRRTRLFRRHRKATFGETVASILQHNAKRVMSGPAYAREADGRKFPLPPRPSVPAVQPMKPETAERIARVLHRRGAA